jgi:hypothetical protein
MDHQRDRDQHIYLVELTLINLICILHDACMVTDSWDPCGIPLPSAGDIVAKLVVYALLEHYLSYWIYLGVKKVRIFSDCIQDRIHLEGFRSVNIRVRIFNIRYHICIEYLNRIFMMSIFNHILSDMVDTIHIRI